MRGSLDSAILRCLQLNALGVWEIDARGRITFVSEHAAAMVGYAPEELVGRSLPAFMGALGAVGTKSSLDRRRLGLREARQASIRHRDGHDLDVLVFAAPILDAEERYQGATAAVLPLQDMPGPAELGVAAGDADGHHAGVGAWELDAETGSLTWSAEAFAIFGVDPTTFEPTYEAAMALIHPHDRPLIERTIDAAAASGKAYSTYFRVVQPDGSLRLVHARGALREPGSRAFVGTMHDVTERSAATGAVSAREREVLDLMAEGLTAEEIGERLQITVATVRSHVQNAMEKLGAHNRVHAVVLALRTGEIVL